MALLALKAAGTALVLNYGIHTGASILHAKVCVPETVWDIARSLVATASPVCSFLLNTMVATQSNYATILTTTIAATLTGMLRT